MKNLLLGLVLTGVIGFTGVECKEVAFGGQFRPRFEFKDPSGSPYDSFTSMRVRMHMSTQLEKNVSVYLELQDVRLWGEEISTLGDFRADNFDLHQAYVDLGKINEAPVSARVGRQAISFGGQRLIGAVEWTQQGRVFDGVKVTAEPKWGSVDVVGIRLADATSANVANSAYLGGIYGNRKLGPDTRLELYTLYNKVSNGVDTDQLTSGFRMYGKQSGFVYRAEGSFQTGNRVGTDVSAFLLGGRLGRKVGRGTFALWYDYLSGDDDATDGKSKVFDTLFATNHKFYGFADVFLNIPAHTGGLGLQDLAVKASFSPGKPVMLSAHFHIFRSAKKDIASDSSRMGEEIDLTVSYKYSPNVSFVGGYSYVMAKDVLKSIGRLSDDLSFGYTMINVSF